MVIWSFFIASSVLTNLLFFFKPLSTFYCNYCFFWPRHETRYLNFALFVVCVNDIINKVFLDP